jgi:hypothetical protein
MIFSMIWGIGPRSHSVQAENSTHVFSFPITSRPWAIRNEGLPLWAARRRFRRNGRPLIDPANSSGAGLFTIARIFPISRLGLASVILTRPYMGADAAR